MKQTGAITKFFLVALLFVCAGMAQATPPQLVDLGNGIYKDTKTGLMWQVKNSHRLSSIDEVNSYLKHLKLGGYSDWRLPTWKERWKLLHVFLFDRNGNCDLKRLGSPYWTTGTEKGTRPIRLEIDCYCRDDPVTSYTSGGYVRAVRDDGKTSHN